MKNLILIALLFSACGSDDSKTEAKPGVDERPILWSTDDLSYERNLCSESPSEVFTHSSVVSICYCIFGNLARIYTYEEYEVDIVSILEAQKPMVEKCKTDHGVPL